MLFGSALRSNPTFEAYIAPARAPRGSWRPIAGCALILFFFVIWVAGVVVGAYAVMRVGGLEPAAAKRALGYLVKFDNPVSAIFVLAAAAGIWPSVRLTLGFLHQQRFATLLSPEGRVRWGEFTGGLALALMFWRLTAVPTMAIFGLPDRTGLPLTEWALILVPLIAAVFFISSAEELIFRGYLLQQLAVRWRSPLVWAGVTSVLFALIHETQGNLLHYAWVAAFGLTAAALVWRTGSLAASMGLHTGINVLLTMGVGHQWNGKLGAQLFRFGLFDKDVELALDATVILCIGVFVLSPYCPLGRRSLARAIPD